MAYRKTLLINGEIYHIFNRSIARQPIFHQVRDYTRFLETIDFYRFQKPGLSYSHYNRLANDKKHVFLNQLYHNAEKLIDLYVFSTMPNHFHFLVKQTKDNGIKQFISNIQNSYAKYYNVKNDRSGSLFQEMFKAIRIETDEQFIHVARYIHLNPLTNFMIKDLNQLENYPWSSFIDYLGKRETPMLNKEMFLGFFSDINKFKKFTLDQVDYQRELENIKHLVLE